MELKAISWCSLWFLFQVSPLLRLGPHKLWGATAPGVTAQTTCTRSLIFQAAGCCWWSVGHSWSPSAIVALGLCPSGFHYTTSKGFWQAALILLGLGHLQWRIWGPLIFEHSLDILKNLSTPLIIKMLQGMNSFIFIWALLMFSSSFLSSLLVHGAVVVKVVILSM